MRVQYRNRQMVVNHSALSGIYDRVVEWGPWRDVRIADGEIPADIQVLSLDLGTQVRIVDDAGNPIRMTPPFTPAYYERRGSTQRPGGLAWFNTEPSRADWIRRDDVKPSGK